MSVLDRYLKNSCLKGTLKAVLAEYLKISVLDRHL